MGKKPVTASTASNTTASVWGAKPSFASLSREWATKQKQEEKEAKREEARNAILERERRIQQEKEDKERRAYQNLYCARNIMGGSDSEDEKKYDLGGTEEVVLEEDSSEPEDYVEDEEEEDFVDDRVERTKHDYY